MVSCLDHTTYSLEDVPDGHQLSLLVANVLDLLLDRERSQIPLKESSVKK